MKRFGFGKEPPKGRPLTDEEEEIIADWSPSRQSMFRLVKQYGDIALLPPEELSKIHELALSEVIVEKKKHVEITTPVVPRSKPNVQMAFEEIDILNSKMYEGNPSLDYEALWDAYPKRGNPEEGHVYGIKYAKHRFRTKEQYDEAFRIIKAYAFHHKRQYGSEQQKFALKFDNFVKKIEDYAGLTSSPQKEMTKTRMQKSFDRPWRPALPWELDPRLKFSPAEKQKAIQELKEKEGYDDKTNDKYWFDF